MSGLAMTHFQKGKPCMRSQVSRLHSHSLVVFCFLCICIVNLFCSHSVHAAGSLNAYPVGQFVVNVPSSFQHVDYSTIFWVTGNPIWFYESMFINPYNGDRDFMSAYQKELRNKQSANNAIMIESLTPDFGAEVKDIKAILYYRKIMKIIDKESFNKAEIKCWGMSVWIKLDYGYLKFGSNFPANDSYGCLDTEVETDIEEKAHLFLKWIKGFMHCYKWAGGEPVKINSGIRTRYGLINMEYNELTPQFELNVQVERTFDSSTSISFKSCSTPKCNKNIVDIVTNKFIFSRRYNNFYMPFIRPRTVATHLGFEIINFSSDWASSVELVWVPLQEQCKEPVPKLIIEMPVYILGRVEAPKYSKMFESWELLLQNIYNIQ